VPPLGGHEPSTSRLPTTVQTSLLGGLEPSTSELPKTEQVTPPPMMVLAVERAQVLEWVSVVAPVLWPPRPLAVAVAVEWQWVAAPALAPELSLAQELRRASRPRLPVGVRERRCLG